jgi:hypothetical protein
MNVTKYYGIVKASFYSRETGELVVNLCFGLTLRGVSVREAQYQIFSHDFLYFPIGVVVSGTVCSDDLNDEPYIVDGEHLDPDYKWLYTVVTGHAALDEEDIAMARVERIRLDAQSAVSLLRHTESIRLNDCDICIRSVDIYCELPY